MNSNVQMRVSGTQGAVVTVGMYVSDCPNCGVIFGITSDYEAQRRKDGRDFRCPNGHVMSWDSADEREKKSLLKAKRELEQRLADEEASRQRYQDWLRREREQHKATERSLAATKGVVTRQRNRAAAALCPVDGCGRSFTQLRRHLATQHPDYPTTSATTAAGTQHTKEITKP